MTKKCGWCSDGFIDTTSNKNKTCCSKICANKLWYKNNHSRQRDKYYKNKDEISRKRKDKYVKSKITYFCNECNNKLNRKSKCDLCPTCNRKRWYKENRDERRNYDIEYTKNNRKKINIRHVERYNSDIKYRLQNCLRKRIYEAVVRFNNGTRISSAVKDLSCSIEELKEHLEALWQPGMSWDNYGLHGWHIDHIKPLSSFDLSNIEEFKEACHYGNLQPLWAKDNISKGNKYDEKI